MAENGPTFLGRNWLWYIRLDWKAIHTVSSPVDSPPHLLDEFGELFSDDLGTITGYHATLDLCVGARPNKKFHRARPIPFAIKAVIEEQLDKLESSGVVGKVPHSNWAAPIVTVPNGKFSYLRGLQGDGKPSSGHRPSVANPRAVLCNISRRHHTRPFAGVPTAAP